MNTDAFFDELEKIAALPGSMLLGTGLGAATGALGGALSSDPKDRAAGALRGGLLGGGMGAAGGAGAHLVRKHILGPKALGVVDDAFNLQSPEGVAGLMSRAKNLDFADKAMHYGVPAALGAAGGYVGGKQL